MAKATFAISISFECKAKDHDAAYELADRITAYVVAEKMASEGSVIDIELLDDDEETPDELDFGDDE